MVAFASRRSPVSSTQRVLLAFATDQGLIAEPINGDAIVIQEWNTGVESFAWSIEDVRQVSARDTLKSRNAFAR